MNGIFTGKIQLRGWNPLIRLRNDRDGLWSLLGTRNGQVEVNDVAISCLKTVKKTIGAYGVTGCDFNFTAPSNTTAQNIDLGAIIPSNARVLEVRVLNTATFTGLTALAITAGNASAGAQFLASVQVYTLNTLVGTLLALLWTVAPTNAASKVWVGATPTANWSLDTTNVGKLEVNITYLEQY